MHLVKGKSPRRLTLSFVARCWCAQAQAQAQAQALVGP